MQFHSIEPFIPSGADFAVAKALFTALGFNINWENNGYAGLQRDACRFILQEYNAPNFAENLMVRVAIDDLDVFWQEIQQAELTRKFAIQVKEPTNYPYGRELHLIDLAGVCWHFTQAD
ncbi:MAG: hypothetical protein ACK4TA_20010 [Saprospiraceae bacterium]